jgi:diaminobutyrate-2-oxoglutarate transaminase
MDDHTTPEPFRSLESQVRYYCRAFPTVFRQARGCWLTDEQGRRYLDFFSGAGTLNYGHNDPRLVARLVDYLQSEGITHSLDMATAAKREFLQRFQRSILAPRHLAYKIQFPGPTGTNAVEAALKLARKVTGRRNVLYFHNAYHGVTLGSLAVTANPAKRRAAGVPLAHTTAVPYDDGDEGQCSGSLDAVEELLAGAVSAAERPAAAIVETVQAEGGVKPASFAWLTALAELLRRHGVLLIVDDIQVGCGRTGPFFSFEPAGIAPDLVCLSKSISGLGLPMSLVLIRPDLDVWAPGEHNGTFRGNNLAFVTAAAALDYWQDDGLTREVLRKGDQVAERLTAIAGRHPEASPRVRGRGLIQGLELHPPSLARNVAAAAFSRGLMIETAGPSDEVLKLLPPLVIDDGELEHGLQVIEDSLAEQLAAVPAGGRVVAHER